MRLLYVFSSLFLRHKRIMAENFLRLICVRFEINCFIKRKITAKLFTVCRITSFFSTSGMYAILNGVKLLADIMGGWASTRVFLCYMCGLLKFQQREEGFFFTLRVRSKQSHAFRVSKISATYLYKI